MKPRGFALILVIWVLVLLSLLAVGFSSQVRVETATGSWLSDQVQLQSSANAAVHRAMLGLAAEDDEQRWYPDGSTHQMVWNDFDIQIVVRNESGKVDINYAPRGLLLRLIQQMPGNLDSNALSDALIDWRDRDNQVSAFGAEGPEYLAAGLSHLPSNGPLSSISELTQVMGFDSALVESLRPYITVHARRPKVDVYSASEVVLASIPGISNAIARDFIRDRQTALANGDRPDIAPLSQAQRYFDAIPSSGIFNIEVTIPFEAYVHREQAVVRLQSTTGQYEILAWETIAQNNPDNNP